MRESVTLSMEAGKNVKVEGKDNNLLELIAADPAFNMTLEAAGILHGTVQIRGPFRDSGNQFPA